MKDFRESRRRDEDGASAVEYGLLAVAIAATIVIIVFVLGGQVVELFGGTCDDVQSQLGNASCARA